MQGEYAVTAPAALAAADEHTEIDLIRTVGAARSVAVQIVGTYSGTLTFKATVDGTTYIAVGLKPVAGGTVATTTTTEGIWVLDVNPGYRKLQVYWTTRVSGAVTVTAIVVG
jgi:hypothetical protein